MRRMPLIALLALVALAGCGPAQSDSTEEFSGAAADVAQVVEDLQSAGRRRDAERICSELLARSLVDRLGAGAQTCGSEVEKAVGDADDFNLTVVDVTVTGSEARAVVERGDENERSTFTFAREGGRWKATGFGS